MAARAHPRDVGLRGRARRCRSKDVFQAHYRGKRYSFGYPACPDLDQQAGLFSLLRPQEIGAELTEGFMMEPEATVSALVFSHPDATYFGVGPQDEELTA